MNPSEEITKLKKQLEEVTASRDAWEKAACNYAEISFALTDLRIEIRKAREEALKHIGPKAAWIPLADLVRKSVKAVEIRISRGGN